jgi:hypothetical protein
MRALTISKDELLFVNHEFLDQLLHLLKELDVLAAESLCAHDLACHLLQVAYVQLFLLILLMIDDILPRCPGKHI